MSRTEKVHEVRDGHLVSGGGREDLARLQPGQRKLERTYSFIQAARAEGWSFTNVRNESPHSAAS